MTTRASFHARPLASATTIAMLAVALLGSLFAGTAGADPLPVSYVAVGDGYSNGQGAFPNGDLCSWTPDGAWPRRVVAPGQSIPLANQGLATVKACTRAKSAAVQQQLATVPTGTQLVTITTGAADVGLPDIIDQCYIGVFVDCAQTAAQTDTDRILPDVEQTLATARQIGATVVVVGYPNVFDRPTTCASSCFVYESERVGVAAMITRLNNTLRTAAQRAGVHFLDTETAARGHGACLNSEPNCNDAWANEITWNGPYPGASRFYLNGLGEGAFAMTVSTLLANAPGPRTAANLPANPAPQAITGPLTVAPAESCRSGSTFRSFDKVRVTSGSVFARNGSIRLSFAGDTGVGAVLPTQTATSTGQLDATFVLPGNLTGSSVKIAAEGLTVHGTLTTLSKISPLNPSLALCDQVAPTATITTPANGAIVKYRTQPTVSYTCNDDRAISSCTGTQSSGAVLNTSVPGPNAFTATARDLAGNLTTTSSTYNVRYDVGQRVPTQDKATGPLVIPVGATQTVHFRILDGNGAPVVTPSAVSSVQLVHFACNNPDMTEIKATKPAPDGSGVVWFTIPARATAGCGGIVFTLADGTTQVWSLKWV